MSKYRFQPPFRAAGVAMAALLALASLAADKTDPAVGWQQDPENPHRVPGLWETTQQQLAIYAELPGILDPALTGEAGLAPMPKIELVAEAIDSIAKGAPPLAPNRRYNQVRQKSTHNSFQKQEAILDQLVYHRVRSLELDLHNGKGSFPKFNQDWYIYHYTPGDSDTTCFRLSDCLAELRAFHLTNPYHEVVTVFLDIKDSWESNRNPADLDSRLTSHIPSSAIYEPGDLMASCPQASTLRSAAQTCGWPLLATLRGKLIFVLTGSDDKLDSYFNSGSSPASRRAFIAPGFDSSDNLGDRTNAVFFNLSMGDVDEVSSAIEQANLVSRAYKVNNSTDWSTAKTHLVHHLATDKVNFHQDSWAKTHNASGWPFECFSACSSALEEGHDIIGVEVDSNDIWGSTDHFRYIYEFNSSGATTDWTAAVNTRNSHTEDWAKGCLMARSEFSANSPYFAVCRPNDDHKLRIQWRSNSGGGSDRTDAGTLTTHWIDGESLSFIRMRITNNNACAAGFGSQDGIVWNQIGSQKCFSKPLIRHGLASSSHDGGTVKFLYSNVKKNGVTYTLGTFTNAASFGTVRSHAAFDGVFP